VDDRLRTNGQRVSVSEGRLARARRIDRRRHRGRLFVRSRKARLVQVSVPGQRRVLIALAACSVSLQGRRGRVETVVYTRGTWAPCDPDQLRAARAAAQYEGQCRLPYVRALQRPSRCDFAE